MAILKPNLELQNLEVFNEKRNLSHSKRYYMKIRTEDSFLKLKGLEK